MKLCHTYGAVRARLAVIFLLGVIASRPARAAEKMRLRVDDYQMEVELLPQSPQDQSPRAKVKVTAFEDLNVAVFQLHNALRVTKSLDAAASRLLRRAQHPGFNRALQFQQPRERGEHHLHLRI